MLKIPPDHTFLIQIALFLVLWLALKRWWFDPGLRVLRERAARSEGALQEARVIEAEAERMRVAHAAALDEARSEAQREMQDILRRAEAEQKRLVTEAREDAQRTLAEVRTHVAEEVAAARRVLRDHVRDIAREVAQRVLGRPV